MTAASRPPDDTTRKPDTLECPCCGDVGAEADRFNWFYDGQPLICGCPGWVSVSDDDEAWINNGDDSCLRCEDEGLIPPHQNPPRGTHD
jgi:hypothetical protein